MLGATFDSASSPTALLIVSGGNEIRSGAHGGMSQLASHIAQQGFPVLRYDRRGIGESTGQNSGFLGSAEEIATMAQFLRLEHRAEKIIAFGNCDAATALALFGPDALVDGYILANPWVIESTVTPETEEPAMSAAAIRSRYWDRIRNPRTMLDLLSGQINFRKLLKGLKQASRSEKNGALALRLRDGLSRLDGNTRILLARRDTTARAFLAAWNSADYEELRQNSGIIVDSLDSASHSFADVDSNKWLTDKLLQALRSC
jgi:exosortase A-associated hydrolase 1